MIVIGCRTAVMASVVCLLCGSPTAAESPFGDLAARLVADGLDGAKVGALYSDPRCEFLPAIAQINLKHVEDTAAYRSFLAEKNLAIAQAYFALHRGMLRRFEARTGVPAEIVVAILLVETKCGRERDKAPVLNVLSTIASCADDAAVEKSYEALRPQYPDLTPSEVRRRAQSRGRWAYKELKAFLEWILRQPAQDAFAIRGSWAGALGLPQFMPTALAAYGADGDGDGRVDLSSDTDSVASVCRYLRENGWRPGRAARAQRRVIWRYNHSPLYVDTVLKISERISNP
ncbi:MAG: hypothetical protein A3G34_04520 [Candidatus Lindowbacteria bacterium RIFCSPLOWO2_12_FULL_62_27]|nr:MAG: hypothetical protein A3I06_04280 [Candidatus Lindowbacteria bacterium RIFCSPLOWO2_02_FULL_62_12]OGH57426.1 MAG: hypothetical protein A3G34_04520 [Candidatus Lindowbacteria bacterium RIFCSPLOWO2_12_FULL_62_27]